ncbi:MAG: nucleotidyltransferase domain-containing protein [Campylobacterota bacterium]|nr:nucleotidyltransferase domain-containing protein [Campylobacterota bacterium]
MRLTDYEVTAIKDTYSKVFDDGKIFLFGSRVDDSLKGGDIDLYIQTDNKNILTKKIKFLSQIKQMIGDQKIDVVISKDKSRVIEQEAIINGIQL